MIWWLAFKKKQLKFTTEELVQAKVKIDSMSTEIEKRIEELIILQEKPQPDAAGFN